MPAPRLTLPWRALNLLGRGLAAAGVQPGSLEPEALIAAARARTGLEDLGPHDPREALATLTEAVRREAGLSFLGRQGVIQELIDRLAERLRVVEALKRHPEIAETPLPPILLLTGLPRTGSTFLHRLLGADPSARIAPFWELRAPAPRPEDPSDPAERIRATQEVTARIDAMHPGMRAIHPMRAEAAEEEFLLLQQSFATSYYLTPMDIPSYRDWLREGDLGPAYRFLRLQLQLLQWAQPGAFLVLKSPFHLFHLDDALDAFPEATFVQLHRAMTEVAGSGASLTASTRAFFEDPVDPERAGQAWLELWSEATERAMAARDARPGQVVIDVHHAALREDPVAVVQRIREQAGLPFGEAERETLRRFQEARAQRRSDKPAHAYSLEGHGLSEALLAEAFAPYMARHGVPMGR
ncbi:MAG: sulfotransferase [Alphaproteobacteria bacterium]|nr:sulfotransferase [Alphaproteobacteria bacterium]MCB9792246.1 sulfotransferase [Alphaproteobacteria bacterium]